jgi:ASC-1-like (ASCH) protein
VAPEPLEQRSLDAASVQTFVRPATEDDTPYVLEAFERALSPYYGGDHSAHARRIIQTHLAGGADPRGLLSARQLLLILWFRDRRKGILNLVFKRQATCKISPLILYPNDPRSRGLGAILLKAAEQQARRAGARQLYCTVAASNHLALGFFTQFGFVICGQAIEQYKEGETEVLLRRPLIDDRGRLRPKDLISVFEVKSQDEWVEARKLLLDRSSPMIEGVDDQWIDSLRYGTSDVSGIPRAERRTSWAFAAKDRGGRFRAVALITSKKGGSLKVMPVVATDMNAFRAILVDLPALIANRGRKAYIHHAPSSDEVAALQESEWRFEAQIPGAYRRNLVTQQWACPLGKDAPMTRLRIQSRYLALIASGQKTLEIRVGYDHIKAIKPGALVRLESSTRGILCEVQDVRRYPDLKHMVDKEDIERAMPGMTVDSALNQLRKIYPPEKERLGIIVLELKRRP